MEHGKNATIKNRALMWWVWSHFVYIDRQTSTIQNSTMKMCTIQNNPTQNSIIQNATKQNITI